MAIFLIAISIVLVSGGLGALWRVISRRSPPILSDEDLSQSARANDLHVVSRLSEDERVEIKTAFLAGPDFQWLVSGNHQVKNSDPEQEHHRVTTFYLVECVLRFAETYGHVIVAREPETDEFLGAICVVPPYTKHWLYSSHFLLSVMPLGNPPPRQMGKAIKARFDAFTDTLDEQHGVFMKETPHWYVANLGVSEAAQGKGVGTKLLQAVFDMAGDMPVYLECHDGNVSYYKKKGFEVASRFLFLPRGIDDPKAFPFNGMVRRGTTSTTAGSAE